MKPLYTFLLFLLSIACVGQVPRAFSYQAMALNASGEPVVSSPVKIKISILSESAAGNAVYEELHNPTTNNKGIFTLAIGTGQVVYGMFHTIDWGSGSKFLKVEIDVNNGNNFVTVGSSQLLSVPYAMVAGTTVGYADNPKPYLIGSFNNFDTNTAIPIVSYGYSSQQEWRMYKYFTAGTALRFCFSQGAQATYGIGANSTLSITGGNLGVPEDAVYLLRIKRTNSQYTVYLTKAVVSMDSTYDGGWSHYLTYNPQTGLHSIEFTLSPSNATYGAYQITVMAGPGTDVVLNRNPNGTLDNSGGSCICTTPFNLPPGTYRLDIDLLPQLTGSHYSYTPL